MDNKTNQNASRIIYTVFIYLTFIAILKGVAAVPMYRDGERRHAQTRHQQNHHRHQVNEIAEVVEKKCPPPLLRMPEDACTQHPCQQDEECGGSDHKCCFNGCLYTCSLAQEPPPVIDWLTPKFDDSDDSLLRNREEDGVPFEIFPGEELASSFRDTKGEICTTLVDQEYNFPLDCPHGYICHITDPGDITHGVPNIGRCVLAPSDVLYDFNGLL